jgi:putative hemolysin
MRTYLLAGRSRTDNRPRTTFERDTARGLRSSGLVGPQRRDDLEREIASLPTSDLLATAGDMDVYYSRAESIPNLLIDIGRLREVAFREVGEGTGQELDLDRFDEYYTHLFIWHKQEHELVGAYRLGPTDEILPEHGVKGLYTRTLYKYKQPTIESISPALELGRSFVRPKYQRTFVPLHLLWKGIGQYIVRKPQYRYLFGPVSISARYHSTSVRLMVDYLERYNFARELARQIKPTRPLRLKARAHWDDRVTGRLLSDLDEISDLVSEIESSATSVPILLKHYLRLGGRVLGFNVDDRFSDVVDALILVDLLNTDRRILNRYFGRSEAESYLAFHRSA